MYTFVILVVIITFVESHPESSEYKYYEPSRSFEISKSAFQNNFNGHRQDYDEGRWVHNGFDEGSYSSKKDEFYESSYQPGPLRNIIQKHIYIHVPPSEPQEYLPQRPISIPPAEKHYKIIFIKAPTPPTPTAPVIPPFPEQEEKTLIYVLVKKPEEAPEIKIPTAVPTKPSKPEVYFIRYGTKEAGYSYGVGGGYSGAKRDLIRVLTEDSSNGSNDSSESNTFNNKFKDLISKRSSVKIDSSYSKAVKQRGSA